MLPRACAVLPPRPSQPQQQLAQLWHPQTPGVTTSPSLALHKTKESQVRTNRKIYIQEKCFVPIEKSLRISKPAATKKKSLAKYFSLGSQFIGSLSLDLLCFRSHPFWPSTTRAMNLGISDQLPLIPIGKVSPTRFAAYEEKVLFRIFNLGLFLDNRHETFLVTKAIPPKVPSLTRGPLDQMGLCKRVACVGKPTQLSHRYKRACIVPRRGQNLCRC
ncbi:hypothetical protein Cgig2_000859 [Carnegiea gigantea]|uniref:Uncharacterized protein n=1 Tax=Carnegiea gigantea TaxID=171969 RepID=A0A9Q1K079_9CARY|nr:hypothetical protein Cgig2_000859 [Carnegiea gigantea]